MSNVLSVAQRAQNVNTLRLNRDNVKVSSDIDFYLSEENTKLERSPLNNWLIFNIPAVVTCPFRTAHCEEDCYAVKSEDLYPETLPSRVRNFEASKADNFVDYMTEYILKKAKNMRKPKLIVRIHESGDFYSRAYAKKWLAIMRNCLIDARIIFIAYTKSFIFFDGVDLPDNFRLRASVWDDTKPEQLAIIKRNGWPIYTAVPVFTNETEEMRCRCKNCAECGKCWNADIEYICCEIH